MREFIEYKKFKGGNTSEWVERGVITEEAWKDLLNRGSKVLVVDLYQELSLE